VEPYRNWEEEKKTMMMINVGGGHQKEEADNSGQEDAFLHASLFCSCSLHKNKNNPSFCSSHTFLPK